MLYVVASVVGAVLKRMQQGPILDHPVFPPSAKPQKQGQVGEEQPREMGDVVVVAMPPVADTPPAMEGQLVEVFESTEEPGFDSVESDVADEQDIWEGLGRSERDYDIGQLYWQRFWINPGGYDPIVCRGQDNQGLSSIAATTYHLLLWGRWYVALHVT